MPPFSASPSFRKSRMSRAQSFPDNRQEFSGVSLLQTSLPSAACCDCRNRRTGEMLMEKLWSYLLPLPKNLLLQENSVIRSCIFWRILTLVFAWQTVRIRSTTKQAREGRTPGATTSPCSTRTTATVSGAGLRSRLGKAGEAGAACAAVWPLFALLLQLVLLCVVPHLHGNRCLLFVILCSLQNSLFTLSFLG